MVGIDRNRVRHAFHQHAAEYDAYADVQKRVVARFLQLLHAQAVSPRRLLDVGAGTGMLLGKLAGLYPQAQIAGLDLAYGMSMTARANAKTDSLTALLTGDAESLPFRDGVFDLVVSTSTFQWLESLDRALAEARRVLAPGGTFAFALFGERTLFELRTSYRTAWEGTGRGPEERTHTFLRLAEIEAVLRRSGFADVRAHTELEIEWHPDVATLLRAIRRIGAGNAAPARSRGLAERRVMLDMMSVYRQEYEVGGRIPATYEVIYGTGRKDAIVPAGRST